MRHIKIKPFEVSSKSGTALFLSLLLAGYSAQETLAGELAYGIGYFGEYSDNILRSSSAPVSDMIHSAVLGVAYRENGPALDAFVLAQAEYRDYKKDTFDDGTFYYADISAAWRILPQRLTWYLTDRYAQVLTDVTRSDTQTNRTNSNVLNTGPDIFFRLGTVNTLVFGLRYGNATYDVGGVGDTRYGASARWQYASDPETTYSLNYEGDKVQYDDGALINGIPADNFVSHDYFIRAEKRRAYTHFVLDLGSTRIERERTEATSGYLARLTWTQQIATGSSGGVRLASEYLDAGTVLLSTATSPTPAPGDPPASPETGEATNDLFYSKRTEVYYNRIGSSFDFNSSLSYNGIEYEIVRTQDRRESGVYLDLSYRPFSLLTATLYTSHLDIQYQQSPARNDRDNGAGLRLTYRLNTNLNAALDGRRTWRYSTDATREYIDRRLMFWLTYSSSSLFTPARR